MLVTSRKCRILFWPAISVLPSNLLVWFSLAMFYFLVSCIGQVVSDVAAFFIKMDAEKIWKCRTILIFKLYCIVLYMNSNERKRDRERTVPSQNVCLHFVVKGFHFCYGKQVENSSSLNFQKNVRFSLCHDQFDQKILAIHKIYSNIFFSAVLWMAEYEKEPLNRSNE